jgi:hypothetical protein
VARNPYVDDGRAGVVWEMKRAGINQSERDIYMRSSYYIYLSFSPTERKISWATLLLLRLQRFTHMECI